MNLELCGQKMRAFLLSLVLIMQLLPLAALPARAESEPTPYTSYTGTTGSGNCWTDGAPSYLVDNDDETKWGADLAGTKYVEFRSAAPITPVGYALTTGGDTALILIFN